MPFFDAESLRLWFLQQKRDLPWRKIKSPYAVLVSEVMLQQTQVLVVIPYFNRFMERFKNFKELAEAEEKELFKYWEGLGYYSRARNLHKAAKIVLRDWNGHLPKDPELLRTIPGIGPYTEGAIRAFAFQEKAAAIDGNVVRVLTRYFGIEEQVFKNATKEKLKILAESALPDHEPWVIAEAMIELGALICKKKPECSLCPLKNSCTAKKLGNAENLPIQAKRAPITPLLRFVPILLAENHILIRKVPEGEIMGGLHEFPHFEMDSGEDSIDFSILIKEKLKIQSTPLKKLKPISHSFTRYKVTLYPLILHCKKSKTPEGFFWSNVDEAYELAFSSGHRQIFNEIKKFNK